MTVLQSGASARTSKLADTILPTEARFDGEEHGLARAYDGVETIGTCRGRGMSLFDEVAASIVTMLASLAR